MQATRLVRIRLSRGEWFLDESHQLGRPGGFGQVFEGRDATGAPVAVKRLHLSATDAAHREFTIAEELAGRSLVNVLPVLDSGQDADSNGYFLVMPRAERSLADEAAARGTLFTQDEAVGVLRQIASGLLEVPDIVHRDLKPDNVLLHEGRWKIADFGIARFVEASTSLNTLKECLSPPFAAPEQWLLERATHATDVYALGCITYVLFTGQPPYGSRATVEDYRQAHLTETPAPLTGVDPKLRALVTAMLRKPPSGRPTLNRVLEVLREVLRNPQQPAPGIFELQMANAVEAERISDAAARTAAEEKRRVEPNELVRLAGANLNDVIQQLIATAQQNASEARVYDVREGDNRKVSIWLGDAVLYIHSAQSLPESVRFGWSGWEPLAISEIQVVRNSWNWHGATLWFMRIRPDGEFRWYKVSYKRNPAVLLDAHIPPFAIQHEARGDAYILADRAAGRWSPKEYEIESGPTPIDDEAVESFIERWLSRLAQAYKAVDFRH